MYGSPRVITIGLEINMSLSCLLLVTGLILLIPLRQGLVIMADGLPLKNTQPTLRGGGELVCELF
jgi:hypothetical protein